MYPTRVLGVGAGVPVTIGNPFASEDVSTSSVESGLGSAIQSFDGNNIPTCSTVMPSSVRVDSSVRITEETAK